MPRARLCKATSWQAEVPLQEFPGQFDGSAQETQIMITRNLDAAELLQVRRKPLGVEQCEFPGAQMFDQRHQRDL